MKLATHATADGKHGRKVYQRKNVLEAAQERLSWAFDTFKNVIVGISGGKDSTVLFELAWREARIRHREIHMMFLDQEAEYQSTIDIVRGIMNRDGVIPHWFQVPIRMTNATSYEDTFMRAWFEGEEWMRPKEVDSIHVNPSGKDRFYPFLDWFEAQWGSDTCQLIGLRSEESLNRYGAVTRHAAIQGVPWSSKALGGVKLYPLYDWTFEDIWTYLGTEKIPYNRVYDWMYAKGMRIPELRVSNLIHERAFKSIASLQEFEPDTYEKLLKRIKGVHTAALYAEEQTIYSSKKLPKTFASWLEYRDFLLTTIPHEIRETLGARFKNQLENNTVYRQQVRQILLGDWENNIPVIQQTEREDVKQKWLDIL